MGTKSTLRVIFSLLLVIVFLVVCVVGSGLAFMGAWLHTYNAFTSKELVAELSVSQLKQDENGQYIDVNYKPYVEQSALTTLVSGEKPSTTTSDAQSFKVYGDTVHVGGPIAKFFDTLTLLNFKTVYKIGKLYGRYNLDNNKEINRKVPASFDLNGGIDATWQNINDHIDQFPYNLFFETTEISTPGIFASKTGGDKVYNLYITNTGFLWELK